MTSCVNAATFYAKAVLMKTAMSVRTEKKTKTMRDGKDGETDFLIRRIYGQKKESETKRHKRNQVGKHIQDYVYSGA